MGITYPSEINRILYKPGGDVGKYARRIALDIAAEAKRLAQVDLGHNSGDRPRTGKLAQGYRVTVIPSTNRFRVDNKMPYFEPIELGAEPHEIHARRVEYLQFTDRHGRKRRVKLVFHPGNKAYRLLGRASETVLKRRLGTFRSG